MQRNRNEGPPPGGLPDRNSLDYRAQKVVLLELVVSPPEEGDQIDELTTRLALAANAVPVAASAVARAIAALEAAALAKCHGEVVRASGCAPLRASLAGDALTGCPTVHAATPGSPTRRCRCATAAMIVHGPRPAAGPNVAADTSRRGPQEIRAAATPPLR